MEKLIGPSVSSYDHNIYLYQGLDIEQAPPL